MIRSLRLGKIWDVESIIEIVNNDMIFLERTQSTPYYHNEELSFNFDGTLSEIRIITDVARDDTMGKYPRSKFGLKLYPTLGVIKSAYEGASDSALKHAINDAYSLTVPEFFKVLKNLKVGKDQQALKAEMTRLVETIKGYPFSQYIFFDAK